MGVGSLCALISVLISLVAAGKNDLYAGKVVVHDPQKVYELVLDPVDGTAVGILLKAFPGRIIQYHHHVKQLLQVVFQVEGYSVHGIQINEREHSELLLKLEVELDLDVWRYGAVAHRDAIVMVSSNNRAQLLDILDENGIVHYLYLGDVVKALDEHDEDISRWQQRRTNLVPFENYPRYDEIDAYLERIAREYPNLVTLVNSGPSFEGRAVKYLKISTTNFTDRSKPIYFIDAAIHAREWVTTPVALYAIHRLVEDLRDADKDLLENIDWIIMPLVNPDGYEYSHTDVRMWRRTRSFNPTVSTECYGVDGNRNFNYSWGAFGVSSNPCSDIYPGTEPFSEIEIRYVRDILHEHVDRIQLYLDIHSYGNYILFPYGDGTLPPNAAQIHHVGAAMGAAIDVHKLPEAGFYLVGNSALVLYPAAGCADDYGQYIGVPLALCLELPDYGFDFRVPPQFIEQINKETWEGIVTSARIAVTHYRARIQNV